MNFICLCQSDKRETPRPGEERGKKERHTHEIRHCGPGVQHHPPVRLTTLLPEGGSDLLFSEKEMAGLVSYVHGGVLSPEGIQRACGAIRDFQALLRQFDLDAPTYLPPPPAEHPQHGGGSGADSGGHRRGVDVISGELEARLGYYGARTATDLQDGAMFDIGGGSAEVLEVRAGEVRKAQSLPIGSLELFNRCVDGLVAQEKGAGADPQHRGRGS
ncbi:MAG: hypothetical protein ACLTG0_08600 [Oscillibacter sp.]